MVTTTRNGELPVGELTVGTTQGVTSLTQTFPDMTVLVEWTEGYRG